MPIRSLVKADLYKDSVALMRVAEALTALSGVRRATLLMGTQANKSILAEAGMLTPEAIAARPDDIMAVIDGANDAAVDAAVARMNELLSGSFAAERGAVAERAPRSLALGVARMKDANLAMISVPGAYAGAEALKALRLGLNVFLFSDNVPVEQERAIKELAQRKGLIVMGPDCGTAILHGVPLGFANAVRRGAIGLVAASGTGLQEVMCQIDRRGEGVSHAIGAGGRDASAAIGGITLMQGLDLLAADAATRVIVLLSKPPAPEVAAALLDRAAAAGKPVVALFLGGDPAMVAGRKNILAVRTLEEAAERAVATLRRRAAPSRMTRAPSLAGVKREQARLRADQRGIRGLYSGGTFCSEAQLIWRDLGLKTRSNVPLDNDLLLVEGQKGVDHAAVDFGSDEFTIGRPHPMIDMTMRVERLLKEARDPAVGVVVLDVVLGHGAHADPAGVLAPAIQKAKAEARAKRRYLSVVAFVCGTEQDPQRRSDQENKLRKAGALLASSSAAAAWAAAEVAGFGKNAAKR
jgi:succinyl-CoA synthetase alpha subunit